ncbi:hypothetical protein [Nocardiopsis ansamitocini]|uniref:Uncharacterized protein n=1 Tax=Nocardiopsis ansamitocini TaxID=1670832 RepID=A0A9W6P899_9ACTN|nr:hypothetical protein [Nocardiopsis ansamitocini]GLU48838.1 hypothetical protein Nans01_31890 [Nocardiopsis ansamitocini]
MSTVGSEQVPHSLSEDLRQLRDDAFTGVLRVTGPPDAAIHFSKGLVTAVETPAAPGAETLLVKAGRVSDQAWTAAYEAVPASGDLAEELVSRGVVSAGALELVCTAALFDGAFALALSTSPRWTTEPAGSGPTLGLRVGIDPEIMVAESRRRFALLSRSWGSPGELARIRPAPTIQLGPGSSALPPAYRDLLMQANGRRTPRDIAFVLGRGVCAVMADTVRMIDRGLLDDATRPGPTEVSVSRRLPEPQTATEPVGSLPQRAPGSTAVRRPPDAERTSVSSEVLAKLRASGYGRHPLAGQSTAAEPETN